MNHTVNGDITITQDIGLASTFLLKGVLVVSPRGILFKENSIQTTLDLRYWQEVGVYSGRTKTFSF